MLSVIIPTKNEEKLLPKLLMSLKRQSFQEFEVIVADANSTDKTRELAEFFGAKVVKGGLPAVGRNNGVKAAAYDDLLFLDADVALPRTFLERNYSRFKRKNLDCAATFVRPISDRIDDVIIHAGLNVGIKALERVAPLAAGFHIFAQRKIFDAVGGFDEQAPYAEDWMFIRSCSKKGARFGVLPAPVHVSVRRLEKDGRVRFVARCPITMAQIALGPVRKKWYAYEFGHESKQR